MTVHNSVHDNYQQLDKLFFTDFKEHSKLEGKLADRELELYQETAEQLTFLTIIQTVTKNLHPPWLT